MNIERQNIDEVNVVLTINIAKSDYQDKMALTLKDYRKKANVPGFRPGMVPTSLLKKMYGKAILVDEVNKAVSDGLYNYIKDNKMEVLGEPLPSKDQPENDFSDENDYTFKFDVALAPEFNISLTAKDKMKFYEITPDEKMIEGQIKSYTGRFGTYEQVDVVEADDMVKGNIVEMSGKKEKEDGVKVENAVLTAAYMKDEKIKKQFIGAKKGDSIVFNPSKAYDGNEAELASLLRIKKEDVNGFSSDVKITIEGITRYKEAEINQELFDKAFGKDAVKSEEEFKAKITDGLKENLAVESQFKFADDVKALIAKKMDKLTFPVDFLKRWVLETNEKMTAEELDKNFDQMLSDLKWQLAKDKIAKENEVKIEQADIENYAKKVAKMQFAQYGMMNTPEDILENYSKDMLKNKDTARNIFERVSEEKVIEAVKNKVAVENKSVTIEEFNKLFEK
ncbi:MAG: trigger factor [Paludibacteraceae bacterium]|nr:trigger factor [Paludibacteraceae bacterium]